MSRLNFWKEFKEFAIKGNMIDLAVGLIIGGAFGGMVNSLVKDVIMPPIGVLLGKVDFSNLFIVLQPGREPGPYMSISEAQKVGAVTLNYGLFVNTIINFVVVGFAVFFLVRAINHIRRLQATTPTPAEELPQDVQLLTEIRDLLKQKNL